MKPGEQKTWEETLQQLSAENPGEWPAGLRSALHRMAPPVPLTLDQRMSLLRASTPPALTFRPRFAPTWRSPVWVAASVLCAFGIGLGAWFWPASGNFSILRSRGTAEIVREGQTLAITAGLAVDDELRLEEDSVLEFSFAGGVHLQLIGPARVRLRGAGNGAIDFSLESGEVFFVSRDAAIRKRFTFATERARYELVGTAGLLTVRDQVETLRVAEGAVDMRPVQNPSAPLRVAEGHWVLVENLDGKLPEVLVEDEHGFKMICHRRDRLLRLAKEEGAGE